MSVSGLEDWGSIPRRIMDLHVIHHIQTDSGIRAGCYSMGIGSCFAGDKEAIHIPPSTIQALLVISKT
jgi:hypothetical protein